MMSSGQAAPAPSEGEPAALRLTVLSLTVALGMLVLGMVILFDARRDAWAQAEQAASNLTTTLAREIARTISVYDLSLQGASDALKLDGFEQLSPQTRHMALFDRAASAENLGSILVLDPVGNVVYDSTSIVPHALNFGDRDYFTVHRDNAAAGLFVSRPYQSRLRGGDSSIAISRRLNGPHGEFAGVVMGAMRLAYFEDLFAAPVLGRKGAISLVRDDGIMVARFPVRAGDAGRDLSGSALVRRMIALRSGEIVTASDLDGIVRLFTFRRTGDLPLELAIAVSVDEIYVAWWRKALGIGSILLVLCGATVSLGLMFRREMLRRVMAERALRRSAEQLEVIAATDVLTGLPNRRAFDARFDLEWRRTVRARAPIALLMIDADYFKLFNDSYGHPEGDRVLQALAGCLLQEVGRAADFCARYGGEEFVVLLPGSDIEAAALVARRIRVAVKDLAVEHLQSPLLVATVSIGVAAMRPRSNETQATLVERADRALYEAKQGGRNRVVSSDEQDRDAPSPVASGAAR